MKWIACWVAVTWMCASLVLAGDWPQLLGPHRNGLADNEALSDTWAKQQPSQVWTMPVGSGYAGPAVVGDQLFVCHRKGGELALDCLAVRDGRQRWHTTWPASYAGGVNPDDGPRCVPLVQDGRVYVFSAAGDLHCVDQISGKKQWSRALARDYRALDGYFGAGSTPILVGNSLLVNVGGKDNAGIVALDSVSGETRWKAVDDQASYSSPVLWPAQERASTIFVTRLSAVGIEVGSGKLLFSIPFGRRGATVNAASPIIVENQLFLTSSYGIGGRLVDLAGETARTVWSNDDSLSSQYPTPLYRDGLLYGTHGREDGATAELRCVDFATGKVQWEEPGFGMTHLILADDKLLALRTEGELVLLEPRADRYVERGRIRVSGSIARALPALSRGHFFLRDSGGQLSCWKLP